MPENEVQELRAAHIKSLVSSALQELSMGLASPPASMERHVLKALEHVVKAREELRKQAQEAA